MVEEQKLFREGLRAALEEAGAVIVAEYGSAAEAMAEEAQAGGLEPGTVVLCSLTLDRWQELVRYLLLHEPDCPILGMVNEFTEELVTEALSNGVLGCMDRTLPSPQWVESVQQAYLGRLSPAQMVVRYPGSARRALMMLSQPPGQEGLQPLVPILTQRERLVLGNLSEGVPVGAIGERIGVPQAEVHEVVESACRKLLARHRLLGVLDRLR